MSIAFRDLPVYDLTGATRNFEQLVVSIGSLEEKIKTLEERKNFKPVAAAVAVRETNKELTPSTTKDTLVSGFVWFNAEAGTVHLKANKLEVALANNGGAAMILPFAFIVPVNQAWEALLEGKIKEVQAAYTFLD